MKKIVDLNKLDFYIKRDKLDIGIVSYGGCGSTCFRDFLKKQGYKVNSPIQNKILCHCPIIPNTNLKFIYIYRDPQKAFLSQYRRKPHIWTINQKKLSNNYNVKLSDENLLKLIIYQFINWTSIKRKNVLVLRYDELFKEIGQNKIKKFLNNKNLKDFPVFVQKNKTETLINDDIKKLFDKYKKQINYINSYPNNKLKPNQILNRMKQNNKKQNKNNKNNKINKNNKNNMNKNNDNFDNVDNVDNIDNNVNNVNNDDNVNNINNDNDIDNINNNNDVDDNDVDNNDVDNDDVDNDDVDNDDVDNDDVDNDNVNNDDVDNNDFDNNNVENMN